MGRVWGNPEPRHHEVSRGSIENAFPRSIDYSPRTRTNRRPGGRGRDTFPGCASFKLIFFSFPQKRVIRIPLMKRMLAKKLFPNLPRLVAMKRLNQLVIVTLLSMLGVCLIVVLLWTRNSHIGK